MLKVNDTVICTFGLNKGKVFTIEAHLKNGHYSCKLKNEDDGKYYEYADRNLMKRP